MALVNKKSKKPLQLNNFPMRKSVDPGKNAAALQEQRRVVELLKSVGNAVYMR